jgi:HSP20 family molecular chaperone IbpA
MSEEIDDVFRDLERALRRMRRLQEEIELYFSRIFGGLEELYQERLKRLSSDIEEPLVEIQDMGKEILVIIDISGMKDNTIDVRVTEDSIVVSGEADEKKMEDALQGWYLAQRKRQFRGVYKLGYKIDPSSVKVEKRGSVLVIRAKKIHS